MEISLPQEERLENLLDAYTPQTATLARAVLAKLRQRLPGAVLLVYDSFNALAIGFGGTDRAADASLSVAIYPLRVNLMFFHGATLPDPQHLLEGSGKQARHLVLPDPEVLDQPDVARLIASQLERVPTWDHTRPQRVVIKSESKRKRPRRPT